MHGRRAHSRVGAARYRCRRRAAARAPKLAFRARCRSSGHGSRPPRGAATVVCTLATPRFRMHSLVLRWKGGPSMRTAHSTRRALVLLPHAAAVFAFVPAFGAKKNPDYWIATWTTALVIRPAGPPGGLPGGG